MSTRTCIYLSNGKNSKFSILLVIVYVQLKNHYLSFVNFTLVIRKLFYYLVIKFINICICVYCIHLYTVLLEIYCIGYFGILNVAYTAVVLNLFFCQVSFLCHSKGSKCQLNIFEVSYIDYRSVNFLD